MYAIIEISGKQYKTTEGSTLRVPLQKGDVGSKLSFDKILLISDANTQQFGSPNIKNAKVTAKITSHGKEKKILVYKKKRRKGYQRKNGHRQQFTEIRIEKIQFKTSSKSEVVSHKEEEE
tara:strand:- start:81424 stop:81783 length:360 start_codon:yes stop_codon:yes gene_type:complete